MLAPIRVTGLGGAYIASAEGVEGSAVNSASPAVRDAFSYHWFDYDVNLSASILSTLGGTDFDNHGPNAPGESHARVGDFFQLTIGANAQLGYWGVTANADLQRYNLTTDAGGAPGLTMLIGRYKLLGAYGFLDDQLVIGAGVRAVTLQINEGAGASSTLLTMTGASPEAGLLVMPTESQWRFGGTLRAPVSGTTFGSDRTSVDAGGVRRAGDFVLPREVVLPWEAEAGVAYQLGPRPLNPGWTNPHDEEAPVRSYVESERARRAGEYQAELAKTPPDKREAREAWQDAEERALRKLEDARVDAEVERLFRVRKARYNNWPRERILLLASVLATAPSETAVSVAGFLDQRRELVGRGYSFTPRIGVEAEPILNRLRARVGSYLEPSRYEAGSARQHFTFGGEVKLFPFDIWGLIGETTWKVSFYLDLAPRYTNGGIGIGTWH